MVYFYTASSFNSFCFVFLGGWVILAGQDNQSINQYLLIQIKIYRNNIMPQQRAKQQRDKVK